MDRYVSIENTLGKDHSNNIYNCKILCVGAGGIGCEVLKNLVLCGFKDIEVIDLDTIDVSNLNRQFLFRQKHVGLSKALTAANAAMTFNKDAKIIAHHGNIKDVKFGIKYIEQFHVVLNALDNVDARKHMNRLCLAADVPLIDSGTTGFLGQVMPIRKNITQCYDCTPKTTQKVYPICTIRSTPDKPVHCIVWGKECFKLIFGDPKESMLYDDEEATGTAADYMKLLDIPKDISKSIDVVTYIAKLLKALFHDDINKKIEMDVYKSAKSKPEPITEVMINKGLKNSIDSVNNKSSSSSLLLLLSNGSNNRVEYDRKKLSEDECVTEMINCILDAIKDDTIGKLAFDKDDDLAMRFVAAAANLRSSVFKIETMSLHDAKGIAGNIIPAIATTNAIIAGVQVMSAVKLLKTLDKDKMDINKACPHTYCVRFPTRKGLYLQPTKPEQPNPNCFVCSKAPRHLTIDVHMRTLNDLVTLVLKKHLGFNEPSINVGTSGIYEEGEDCDEDLKDNLPKLLKDVGIIDGAQLSVEDFSQDLEVTIIVRHTEFNEEQEEKYPDKYMLTDTAVKDTNLGKRSRDEGDKDHGEPKAKQAK